MTLDLLEYNDTLASALRERTKIREAFQLEGLAFCNNHDDARRVLAHLKTLGMTYDTMAKNAKCHPGNFAAWRARTDRRLCDGDRACCG